MSQTHSQDIPCVDILIVGFGLSVVPLVRELERSNTPYKIISKRDSVWTTLAAHNKLDFDLVSSSNTSLFSFDLVKEIHDDYYMTAKEFHAHYLNYLDRYGKKIIDDIVERVQNYSNHSIVYTKSGNTYKVKQLVFATGFKRNILKEIANFDHNIQGKTIVFTTLGDSSNMLISKLVPNNNKIYLVHNGIVLLDKRFTINGITYTVDQLEAHNIGFFFKSSYRAFLGGDPFSICHKANFQGDIFIDFIMRIKKILLFSPLFCRHDFMHKRPEFLRDTAPDGPISMPIPNGITTLKYWPIDQYSAEFKQDLESAIKQGYYLNDLPFFINEGLVESWQKKDTVIDHEKKCISYNGEVVEYDHLIEGDPQGEQPNLPPIEYQSDSKEMNTFSYVYKDHYLGVIPKQLSNIYFIGFTRPQSGGLPNIVEMQSLFVHKMLTQPPFKKQVTTSLPDKITKYNKRYYPMKKPGGRDHAVYFGFYTEDVAREMGIQLRLRDFLTPKKLTKFFMFPNVTFKYRERGEYKIDGVDKLIEHHTKKLHNFAYLWDFFLIFNIYKVIFYLFFILSYFEGKFTPSVAVTGIIATTLFSRLFAIFTQSYRSRFKLMYMTLTVFLMAFFGSQVFLPFIIFDFGLTFIKRQMGSRPHFNDIKFNHKYRNFLKDYFNAFSRAKKKTN